jgi:2-phosphosulfolactate phosphatase
MRIHVLPAPVGPLPGIPDAAAVIIDVLRATSTLTQALANGAAGVIEAATVDEALALGQRHPGSLLCGEREGRIIPGFDLGNSPSEYTSERVAGRTLVFASTNGSQALRLAAGRTRILAAFVNLSAVIERLRGAPEIVIVCSGKLGEPSIEDTACAGLLVRRLRDHGGEPVGEGATRAEHDAPLDAAAIREVVEGSEHGRYLRSLADEFARDVAWCASLDVIDQVFEV